jgi:hypothetical protein
MGKTMGQILIALMLPAVTSAESAVDRSGQSFQNLRVAFALAAYRSDAGQYPAQLDELVPKYLPELPPDVFSTNPLQYRPTENGYLFYSVGVNGKDEEGRGHDDMPPGDDLTVHMPPIINLD